MKFFMKIHGKIEKFVYGEFLESITLNVENSWKHTFVAGVDTNLGFKLLAAQNSLVGTFQKSIRVITDKCIAVTKRG